MSLVQRITGDRLEEVLVPVIRQHRPAVISFHGARGWRMLKSTFMAGSPALGYVELTAKLPAPTDRCIVPDPTSTLGVTFRRGQRKCLFSTALRSLRRKGGHVTLTIGWPGHVDQLQRRMYERALPPRTLVIPVRLWRERESSGDPIATRTVRYGQLEDLSVGGVGVRVARGDDFQPGCTVRCVFAPSSGRRPIVAESLVRHSLVSKPGHVSIGLQFAGLETTAAGRQVIGALARVVTRFQRDRARKQRTEARAHALQMPVVGSHAKVPVGR